MGKRDRNEELLALINHRLGLLEEVSHRTTLLDVLNARVDELNQRLSEAAIDREAVAGVAANLRDIAISMAERFEAGERRLREMEGRLDRLITSAEEASTSAE